MTVEEGVFLHRQPRMTGGGLGEAPDHRCGSGALPEATAIGARDALVWRVDGRRREVIPFTGRDNKST